MKIAIIGYGRMGHEVEKQAQALSFPITKKIDSLQELKVAEFAADEVAIEFTDATAFLKNIAILCQKKVKVISGTTGWQQSDTIKQMVLDSKISFLPASNFSIGVNLFWLLLERAAKLMNSFPMYDVMTNEIHHKDKADSPSGTALTAANILLEHLARKDKIVTDKLERPLKANEIHVSSTRGGYVCGKHAVIFDSIYDEIQISHNAKNRQGFAQGAIEAAAWLYKQKPGYFNIQDFIKDRLNG